MAGLVNPFFNRGPVRDPSYFFGRKQEVSFLFDLLRQGQNVAISGPRRFGKTSLLFYITTSDTSRQYGFEPESVRWVYLDGGMLDGMGEEWLYGAIDRELGNNSETITYAQLLERLREQAMQASRLIVILDEFELFATNPQLQQQVFNRLRALATATQFEVQFVIASKEPLARLSFVNPDILSSPFFNIFAPMSLALFQEDEAVELLVGLSQRSGQVFAPDTIAFLMEVVGPHPLFLQVAGYRAFTVQQGGFLSSDARRLISQQILTDLEGHLDYYWSHLTPEQQYALAALPLSVFDRHSPTIKDLTEAGLLRRDDYLGSVLRDFVFQQPVEGVFHYGPFSMDDRLKLVTVNAQLIHLTPTEFAALRLFLQHPGKLITPDDIETALWPTDIAPDPERARGVMKKLRSTLGEAGNTIVNRRGQGYLLSLK